MTSSRLHQYQILLILVSFCPLIRAVSNITENASTRIGNPQNAESITITFDRYHTFNEILLFMRDVARVLPNIASTQRYGTSYEGRDLEVIRMCAGSCGEKPVILIECGAHGHEWIAPEMCLYIITALALEQNYAMLASVNVYVIPVANPDGFEYTRQSSQQRFWRKTRSMGQQCYGTDFNRNFAFRWGELGASAFECDDNYRGSRAFVEPETVALAALVDSLRTNLKLYLSFHGRGPRIIYPWRFTNAFPFDHEELHNLGMSVSTAIYFITGVVYSVGLSPVPVSGTSVDWVKAIGGVKLAFQVDLPGIGTQGSDPPTMVIIDIIDNMWEGVIQFHQYIVQKFG